LRPVRVELPRFAKAQTALNAQRNGDEIRFESEEGRVVSAKLMNGGAGKAAVYLGPIAGAQELAGLGYAVLVMDPPAAGAKTAWLALMIGRPVTGIRVNEIVRGIDALAALNLLPGGVVLGYAKGRHGAAMLHAAAADPRIKAVAVEGSLISYAAVAAAPVHRNLEEAIVPGVLTRYDLPDLAAAIAPRPVWVINATSPTGSILPRREAERSFPTARVLLRREDEALTPGSPLADRLRRDLGDIH
jgi:hypothetical protein